MLFHTLKALLIALFKLIAIALAFSCRMVAMVLTKISELLEKATGNAANH
jgi:hypothetical protein